MNCTKSNVLGLDVITPAIARDERGTFVEPYNEGWFRSHVRDLHFVRDAFSTSCRGVLRGIHFDATTWKLIQCLRGEIYFVVVDMREESETYLKWEHFELSEANRMQVLVPPLYGNGHYVVSDQCMFHYKMTAYYAPENEQILRWNNENVQILWPTTQPVLSAKDATGVNPLKAKDVCP